VGEGTHPGYDETVRLAGGLLVAGDFDVGPGPAERRLPEPWSRTTTRVTAGPSVGAAART
jgi:hypothetical protein